VLGPEVKIYIAALMPTQEATSVVYCAKCGQQNEEAAQFCSKCGASLAVHPTHRGRDCEGSGRDCEGSDKECERQCYGSSRGAGIFWGIVILLIGIAILFELVLSRWTAMPDWIRDFDWWILVGLFIALAIIAAGIRVATRRY
jgi:hypothetical protein